MNDQHVLSSKNHSNGSDQSTKEPLLNGKQGGNDPPPSQGNGNDDTRAANGSSAQAKTVKILDSNENKRVSNVGGDTETAEPISVAPDGGWGWVILFSSFAISMLVDGVCFSFGIFFDEFRSEFQASKAETSWIGSVLNGTYLAVGPVVSALVNVFGCKKVVTVGAVIAFIGFFASAFSRSLGFLIFSYSFLGGLGFGLMYLPAIVMVGYYFEQRRALATGIACCGSGIGAFCFAPLCEYLLEEFGWRGATWIISAIVLNGALFAMFYKPLPLQAPPDSHGTNSATSFTSETEGWQAANPQVLQTKEEATGLSVMSSPVDRPSAMKHAKKNAEHTRRVRSVSLNEPSSYKGDLGRLAKSTDLGMMLRKRSDTRGHGQAVRKGISGSEIDYLSPLQRKDIFYSGSLLHLREKVESGVVLSVTSSPRFKTSTADLSGTHQDHSAATAPTMSSAKTFSMALHRVFDFSLLQSPTFLIYGWACFLCMAGFFVPFIYMPTHAIDLGLDSRNAAFLISIIGITNTVGRVAVGFLSDQPWADCLLINNVALILGGIATMFVPYYKSYAQLAIYSSVFGLAVAVFVSLRSIIMVELMGLDRLTSAFGLVIMCQGISAFVGAPIAGSLSDTYGNYDAAFYLAGISFALSGMSCIPLRRISRWENERAAKKARAELARQEALSAAVTIE